MEAGSNQGFLATRWNKLNANRGGHLSRCRECAEVTIPAVLPPEGADENTKLDSPYQGFGARAVNSLASKLLITILPANTPFIKLSMPVMVAKEMANKMGDKKFETEIQSKLALVEQAHAQYVESRAYRVQMFKALKYLIVTGNVLLEMTGEGLLKVHRLDKYVVRRNPSGQVVEVVLRERISPDEVPEALKQEKPQTDEGKDQKYVDMFTGCRLVNGAWVLEQEIYGKPVPGSSETYPKDKSPFIALGWMVADGENYGRGPVEEYLGDFIAVDGLEKNLLEGSAIMSLVKFLVDPNSTTDAKELEDTPNGGFVEGREQDVQVLQVQKYADFRAALEQVGRVSDRLAKAFLMVDSIQRDAERVTAEEIRILANEIEDTLGGIYSILSQDLQLPFARLVIQQMKKEKLYPPLPPDVQPSITTGFEALGRGHDLQKLRGLLEDLTPLGPEVIQRYLNVADYIERCAIARGVDTTNLVNDEETIAAGDKQAQMQAMLEKLGPNFINAMAQNGGLPMGGQGQGENQS